MGLFWLNNLVTFQTKALQLQFCHLVQLYV